MIKLNQIIFKKIISFYLKYIYLLLFLLLIFFAFTDLYLKDLTQTKTQLKKIEMSLSLSDEQALSNIYNITYYNLVRNIYSNLIAYKIQEDFNQLYKNNNIINKDGFKLNLEGVAIDVTAVQRSIISKISRAFKDNNFLNSNMRFGVEYIENQMINSDNKYSYYFDLQNAYNLESEQKIKNDLFNSLDVSLKTSFSKLNNDLDLSYTYTNYLIEKEIFKVNNSRFSEILREQHEKLSLSYNDAKIALDYFSNPKNFASVKVKNYNFQNTVPSFIITFLFTFIILNAVILVIAYIYYYFKTEN